MNVKLTGFEDLEGVFRYMEQADKQKIIISAYKKAVKPTYEVMKSLTPKGKTLNLWRSIGIQSMIKRGQLGGKVGVMVGARVRGGFKGYHGYIVEYGTVDRWAKTYKGKPLKKPRFTGKMPYKGFVRGAVRATEKQVVNTVEREWHNAIKRFIIRNK